MLQTLGHLYWISLCINIFGCTAFKKNLILMSGYPWLLCYGFFMVEKVFQNIYQLLFLIFFLYFFNLTLRNFFFFFFFFLVVVWGMEGGIFFLSIVLVSICTNLKMVLPYLSPFLCRKKNLMHAYNLYWPKSALIFSTHPTLFTFSLFLNLVYIVGELYFL